MLVRRCRVTVCRCQCASSCKRLASPVGHPIASQMHCSPAPWLALPVSHSQARQPTPLACSAAACLPGIWLLGCCRAAGLADNCSRLSTAGICLHRHILELTLSSALCEQVYVGNLVSGLVAEDALRQLFNSTMRAAFPDKIVMNLDPVVAVSLHSEGRYAFVELRTPEMATAALQLSNQVQ